MSIEVPAFSGITRIRADDWRALILEAHTIGTHPECLASLISKESGFRTAIKNPSGTATGYLQWTEQTAKALGTTTAKIARMTPAEQIALAGRTFRMRQIPLAFDLADCGQLGLVNFLQFRVDPDSNALVQPLQLTLGMSDEEVLLRKPSRMYRANAGLDSDKDGVITVGEVRAHFRRMPSKAVVLQEGSAPAESSAGEGASEAFVEVLPIAVAIALAIGIAKARR